MLDNLSRKQHLLLDAEAAERIVGEWGRVHDEEGADRRSVPAEEPHPIAAGRVR